MDNRCKIYVDQLRDGHTEQLHETFPATILDQSDRDLSFTGEVAIDGEAYRADKELILHLKIKATAIIPCAICNEPVTVLVELPNFYHAEPIDDIKTGVFDFSDVMREAVILEAPRFAECGEECSKRDEVAKYLKDESDEEEGFQPFADLDLK